MRIWPWIAGFMGASAATLLYGALVEANRLAVERRRLTLPLWPASLDGYRIALLADFHLRDRSSVDLGKRAVAAALEAEPNAITLLGDYVGVWDEGSIDRIIEVLEPLGEFDGPKLAVPGNHDYWRGMPDWLAPVFDELGIELLRNVYTHLDGVTWIGIDSANEFMANPFKPFRELSQEDGPEEPIVVLWHEPDVVGWLPPGAALMLSGHSHGGQFTFPWGWTPMHTENGRIYVKGFYPDAPTPIYVSRGLGVTGPPSRLCCTPEVSVLDLYSGGGGRRNAEGVP